MRIVQRKNSLFNKKNKKENMSSIQIITFLLSHFYNAKNREKKLPNISHAIELNELYGWN